MILAVAVAGCSPLVRRPGDCITVLSRGRWQQLRKAGVPTEASMDTLLADDAAAQVRHRRGVSLVRGGAVMAGLGFLAGPGLLTAALDNPAHADGATQDAELVVGALNVGAFVAGVALLLRGSRVADEAIVDYNDRARDRGCHAP